MTLKDEFIAAIAEDRADATAVIAEFGRLAVIFGHLIQRLDDATAGETLDADTIRGIITQMKDEHAAVGTALAASGTLAEPPLPTGPLDWSSHTITAAGEVRRGSASTTSEFTAQNAGTTGDSEPAFDYTLGNSTVDNPGPEQVEWLCSAV